MTVIQRAIQLLVKQPGLTSSRIARLLGVGPDQISAALYRELIRPDNCVIRRESETSGYTWHIIVPAAFKSTSRYLRIGPLVDPQHPLNLAKQREDNLTLASNKLEVI